MRLACAAVGIVLSGLAGCEGTPDLPDLFQLSDYRKPFDVKLRFEIDAPVIVLGSVEKARPVGRPKNSIGDPRILIQLTKITLRVEQVLRGSIRTDHPLDFYYYTFSRESTLDLGIPSYQPIVGERRIFFLQPCAKGYRSVGDVANYTLAVRSGYHNQDLCRGKPVGCCISEILLVPGKDYKPESFAIALVNSEYVASVLCSRTVALGLVQKLLQSPDRAVAQAAAEIVRAAKADGEL